MTSFNYFPTPDWLADQLVEKIGYIGPNDYVLEPSMGRGSLARAIWRRFPDAVVHGVEISAANVDWLFKNSYENCGKVYRYDVEQGDFLKYKRMVDVVVMNPPFQNGFQDIDHFMHAFRLLKPGGRIAAILHKFSAFPAYHSGKAGMFERFIANMGLEKAMLPPKSFAPLTNTDTCMVWGSKPINVTQELLPVFPSVKAW